MHSVLHICIIDVTRLSIRELLQYHSAPGTQGSFSEYVAMANANPELRRQVINIYKGAPSLLPRKLSSMPLTQSYRAARDGEVLSVGLFLFPT
jgi:hypothetical protein